MKIKKLNTSARLFYLPLLLSCFFSNAFATQITIVNLDGANEGFNDTTVVVPVGGNIGTTLGEQRLIAFQYAAKIWESIISSNVEIKVEAQFNVLTCDAGSGVLGSAGAQTLHGNFSNAPVFNIWYPQALANSLDGSDLSTSADIGATFNSQIDNNNSCLNNTNWYYGIDGNGPSGDIDFLTVILHEVGHGLGFSTFVDTATGERNSGFDDAYMINLEDHSTGLLWSQMSDAQRVASAIDTGDLHWIGAAVTNKIGDLTSGVSQGHVRAYAPDPVNGGSSVSHFDTALAPNELMEPSFTEAKSGPGLAVELMQDIGWNVFSSVSPIISLLADVSMSNNSDQLDFVVGDNDTMLNALTFSFVISNTAIIDQAGLSVSGSGVTRTLDIINPLATGSTDITITVSDGSNSASETFQLTVTAINTPPVVTISAPLNNANVTVDDSVLFQASANDAEDGDLSASLTWISDIDGSIGAGGSISTTLSAGAHSISASVTDSGSLVTIENIILNVFGDSDNDDMNDLWEIDNFGDLTQDGVGDFDNDGVSNLDEYLISITVADGDVNGDGLVNVADLLLMTKHVVGTSSLTALQIARGDVYPQGASSGVINLSDLVLLQKQILVTN